MKPMGQWLDDRIAAIGELDRYSTPATPEMIRAKLDANENWHISAQAISDIARASAGEVDVRAYPLSVVDDLRRAMASWLKVAVESVIPTEGADQGIDLICQAFLRQADKAVVVSPTYSFYGLRARAAGARCVQVSLAEDFSLPVDKILREAGSSGVVFLCSPNNPTGNQFPSQDVLLLCDRFQGLLVVDEAYVDFASDSVVELTQSKRNLIVLRTFSKAFGLADLRLGVIVANPDWAPTFLERVQYPYPISGLAATIALNLLSNFGIVERGVESLKQERAWLTRKLGQIEGVKVCPSQANFLLIELPVDCGKVHAALVERGFATKRVGPVLNLLNCIRVTVGTREMNEGFADALTEAIQDA